MVVNIGSSSLSRNRQTVSARSLGHVPRRRVNDASQCVTIGLVNNMAGAVLQATERQFISLLDTASEGIPIHVSIYALPGPSPAESGGRHFASHYASVTSLLNARLDGLIVTGTEPKMAPSATNFTGRASRRSRSGRETIHSPQSGPAWPHIPPSCTWTALGAARVRKRALASSSARRSLSIL